MEVFEKVSIRRAAGYSEEGTLKASDSVIEWAAGGQEFKFKKEDINRLTWTPLHFGFQLAVSTQDGSMVAFTGLKHEAFDKLTKLNLCELEREEFSTKGHNWGKLEIDGKTVVFRGSTDKPIFKIPLPDVSTLQYGKDDITFEFSGSSDTRDGEDVLVGMSFHVPTENCDFLAEGVEEQDLPAKRLYNLIVHHIDAAGRSEQPIGTFEEVTVLVPRGRFEVQLHHSYLKMLGQAQDFKINYNSILHLFVLPKPNPSMTVVVVTLDPPIRKGQTFYNHVLFQFETDSEMSLELNLTQEELDRKNQKHGGEVLRREMSSMAFDVFATCVKGLSGASITRPRTFNNYAKDGHCIRCSYKADEGYLFPLERAFFYIHKPPICITHDEIDSIEFQRQGRNVVSASVKTFDLCIRTKQGQDHQFRGIQRNEWQLLFSFMTAKNLNVENAESVRQGPAQHVSSLTLEDMDLPMSRDDSDDSDPDFEAQGHEEEEEEKEESDSSSGAEMVDESQISDQEEKASEVDTPAEEVVPKDDILPSNTPKKRNKARTEDVPEKKKRKKKDKNAPKRSLSAFMFYSQDVRDSVKQQNPEATFGDLGRLIGEKWKGLSEDEKGKYQQLAEKDKIRYQEEMAKYTASQAGPSSGGQGE